MMNIQSSVAINAAFCFLLIALDAFVVLRYTVWAKRAMPRWVGFIPALALVAMVADIYTALQMDVLMVILQVPLFLATLLIFIGSLVGALVRIVRRVLRKSSEPSVPAAHFRIAKGAVAALCGALVVLSGVRQTEMYAYTLRYDHRFAVLSQPPHGEDFSALSRSQAFDAMIQKLKAEYPFTAHKQLDWDALAAEFGPRIAAEAEQDSKAYCRALREFAWCIPDSHVGLEGDDHGLAEAEVGGSYGLVLMRLDDGGIVTGQPITQTKIGLGAEIIGWNGKPMAEALAQTSVIWSEYPPATVEAIKVQQLRFLNRGPVGSQVEVRFRNRGDAAARTTTLTAFAAPGTETSGPQPDAPPRSFVESKVLPSGFGHIRIDYELPSLFGFLDKQVQQAVAGLSARQVPGIIVDVRNNFGGEEGLTAGILAPFHAQPQTMHILGGFDRATGTFRAFESSRLVIEPAPAQYHGPVAVLIDHYSHSAAEDIAHFIQALPNGFAVGMDGTAAGGGASSKEVLLPGDYALSFPKFQQLDDAFAIGIESDHTGTGGVAPDIRVPLNDATVTALAAGRDVVLEHAEAALNQQIADRK